MLAESDSSLWHPVEHPVLRKAGSELWIAQPTVLDRDISGNKAAKLRHHLKQAQAAGSVGLATFGGAFSNHLLATAAACKAAGLRSWGWVRADRIDPENPTLRRCQALGMVLKALDRQTYRLRNNADWLAQQQRLYPGWFWVPEGGTSDLGVAGVRELSLGKTPSGPATHLVTATGSGGTIAGLALGHPQLKVLGMSVVKDSSLAERIQSLGQGQANWFLETGFVGAGYGRFDAALLTFCLDFKTQTGIRLEPIYTGKALYGLLQLIEQGAFEAGSRFSFFHTGGLQGLDGLRYRSLITEAQWRCLRSE